MLKRGKQKEGKRRLNPHKVEVYDVYPSIQKENPKGRGKTLQKRDRSESCL